MLDRDVLVMARNGLQAILDVMNAQIGTAVIPVVPVVPIVSADPEVSPEFKALADQPDMDVMGLIFHLHRRLTAEEMAYFRAHHPEVTPTPTPTQTTDSAAVDAQRRSGIFEPRSGSRQFWHGDVGQIISLMVPLPPTFSGTLEAIAGESPNAGVKVDMFDCWVSQSPGGYALGGQFVGGSYANVQAPIPAGTGTVYVNIRPQSGPGGGFSDIQLHPA